MFVSIFSRFSFDIIGTSQEDGTVTLSIDEIKPGESKSVNVTIVAKLYGIYDSTRATVSYTTTIPPSEDEEDLDNESDETQIRAYSSGMPRTKIISKEDHLRISSYYAQDWIVFVLLTIVTTVIPFATWRAKNQEANSFSKKRKSY